MRPSSLLSTVRLTEPSLYALLRAVFGIVLFTHGLPKAMGTSHGSMADPMAGSIKLMGFLVLYMAARGGAWSLDARLASAK